MKNILHSAIKHNVVNFLVIIVYLYNIVIMGLKNQITLISYYY